MTSPFTPPETWFNTSTDAAMMNARIRDKITELQNAASAVIVTTDWTDLAMASGVTQYLKKPQYRVIGGQVQLRGGISYAFGASGGPFTLFNTGLPFDTTAYGSPGWGLRVLCPSNNGVVHLNPRTTLVAAYTFGVPSTAPTSLVLDGAAPWPSS